MSGVVIHEFEVVAEPVPARAEPERPPAVALQSSPSAPSPADIERIERRARERALRVRIY